MQGDDPTGVRPGGPAPAGGADPVLAALAHRLRARSERQQLLTERLRSGELRPGALADLAELAAAARRGVRDGDHLLVMAGTPVPGSGGVAPTPLGQILSVAVAASEAASRTVLPPTPGVWLDASIGPVFAQIMAELLAHATAATGAGERLELHSRWGPDGGLVIELVCPRPVGHRTPVDELDRMLSAGRPDGPVAPQEIGLFLAARLALAIGGRLGVRPPAGSASVPGPVPLAVLTLPPSVLDGGRGSAVRPEDRVGGAHVLSDGGGEPARSEDDVREENAPVRSACSDVGHADTAREPTASGAARNGAGQDSAGQDGAGRDGAGRDGAGRDGAAREPIGSDAADPLASGSLGRSWPPPSPNGSPSSPAVPWGGPASAGEVLAPNGSAPNGSIPNGSAPNGSTPQAAAPTGRVSNDPAPNELGLNGPVPNGPVPNGPVSNGPVSNGPVSNGPAPAGPGSNDAVPSWPPVPSAGQNRPADGGRTTSNGDGSPSGRHAVVPRPDPPSGPVVRLPVPPLPPGLEGPPTAPRPGPTSPGPASQGPPPQGLPPQGPPPTTDRRAPTGSIGVPGGTPPVELFGPFDSEVPVPVDDLEGTPIFAAVASAWFREPLVPREAGPESPRQPTEEPPNWRTVGDAEFDAARSRADRSAEQLPMRNGLPVRRPGQQMVPPSRRDVPPGQQTRHAGTTERQPDRVRSRLTSYQRGLREGRHRASEENTVHTAPHLNGAGPYGRNGRTAG